MPVASIPSRLSISAPPNATVSFCGIIDSVCLDGKVCQDKNKKATAAKSTQLYTTKAVKSRGTNSLPTKYLAENPDDDSRNQNVADNPADRAAVVVGLLGEDDKRKSDVHFNLLLRDKPTVAWNCLWTNP